MAADSSDDANDVGSAAVLIGFITFLMGMIYLLFNRNADVQHYSWNTLSGAICNFIGAMIAKAWGDTIGSFYPEAGPEQMLLVWFIIVASWFVLLQLFLAITAGACSKSLQDYHRMSLNLKCEGTILGLVTGCSSMTLWGSFQLMNFSTVHWVIPTACFVLWGCFFITHKVRKFVSRVDEAWLDKYEDAWDESVAQTENSVMTLTMGHIIVQAIRYYVSGTHPLANGADPPGFQPTLRCAFIMDFIAAALIVAYLIVPPILPGGFPRGSEWIKGTLGISAAFTSFWALDWYVGTLDTGGGNNTVLALAWVVSLVSSLVLFVIYHIARLRCMPKFMVTEVKSLVTPFAFLIGYSWKQATLSSISVVVDAVAVVNAKGPLPTLTPSLIELILAIAVCLVVIPAWRWYILPVLMDEKKQPAALLPAHESYRVLPGGALYNQKGFILTSS